MADESESESESDEDAGDAANDTADDSGPTPRTPPGPTPDTIVHSNPAPAPPTFSTTNPSLAASLATAAADTTGLPRTGATGTAGSSLSVTTAAEALRDEEVHRTRLFIRLGWIVSVAAIGTIFFVDAPPAMDVALVSAMVLGMVLSFYFHQRFRDPRNYTERAMLTLAVVASFNANVAILYFGAFTLAPVILVLGIHFASRSEAERAARVIVAECCLLYAVIAAVIIAGIIEDPGVFATDRPTSRLDLGIGALFVLGTYGLAHHTARAFRKASLRSIEQLQHATRLASQREALMHELRADLERALRVGGPGRYTDQIVGSFKLGVVIGRGAMGEVYEATGTTTAAPAAVKLLRRELLADPTQVARFLREARAGGALASPHIVRVLETSQPDAALPYLAMERLHGHSLADLLRREAQPPRAQVVEMIGQIGAGIDAATGAGIVHRDLKPQNLFRCDLGSGAALWKILDFGIATLSDDTGTLTHGGIVGTPSYMAPEQARGDRVDHRADLHALAAVAYRCLTGRNPFTGPDTPTLLYAVVHRQPIRPSAIADLPADVDRWMAIALAKDREHRFDRGSALYDALAAALRSTLEPHLRKRGDALIKASPWETAA